MRKIILTLSFLAATLYASAQITLSVSGYTSPVTGTTDTLKVAKFSSLPALTTGPNQTWDFSGITYDSTYYQQHSNVPAGVFSATAQYTDSIMDSIGYYYYYFKNEMIGIATSGLLDYGAHFDQQNISMQPYTMSPNDSLTILSQDIAFQKPVRNIAFPATYATHWADTTQALIHGRITVNAFQYFDSAFVFHTTYRIYDTVSGWGTLKIKNSAGIVTDLQVLLVKSLIYRIDSTIVGGTPITEFQHDYTELPVGFPASFLKYEYYAANEVMPIVEVSYDYSSATTPRAVVLSKEFQPSTGITEITDHENISVYPNPVSNHVFYISIPKGNGANSYDIINTTGQMVCSGAFSSGQSSCRIALAKEIAPGTYYVRIMNNGKQMATQKLMVE